MYADIRVMGAEFLAEMLETNTVLEVLQLDGNKLGDLGAESLAEGLKHNQKLQHLFVGNGNEVADYGAMKLAEALENNKQLKTLGLQGNSIVFVGLQKLASVLPSTAIETLNLKENAFKSSGANKLFAALKAHPSNLLMLDVSANHIANDAANAIRDYLATNPALLALDLSFNRLRPGGIAALLQGLSSNTNLRRLDLSGNQIEAAGAAFVAEYLASRGGDNPCGVTNLGLGMGYIGDDGTAALANALANDQCVTILSLASYNEITDAGATAIAKMIETNNYLLALDVSENKIGEAGCDAIAAALQKNSKLQYLKIMGCTRQAERAIEQALERNKAAAQEESRNQAPTTTTTVQASAQDEL
jgi:Leucine-rich repeat (LRR) protein